MMTTHQLIEALQQAQKRAPNPMYVTVSVDGASVDLPDVERVSVMRDTGQTGELVIVLHVKSN